MGALGFVFWNNFLNKKANTTNSVVNKETLQAAALDKTTQKSNILSIHELGISIVVPDSIKDLTYTYTADGMPTHIGGSNIDVGSVNFSSVSLTNKYPECSSDKANPLGSLTKITGTYGDGVLGPTWSGGGVAKQFPDSFLTFVGPQFACFSVGGNDTALGVSVSSQMNDLSASIKRAKETPAYTLNNAVGGINSALAADTCDGKASVRQEDFIQVKDTDPFEYHGGKSLIDQHFDFAYVQYGCGSQGSVALMKRLGESWKIISSDARVYPMCAAIRNEQFPLAIVDKCYEAGSTDPTAIK